MAQLRLEKAARQEKGANATKPAGRSFSKLFFLTILNNLFSHALPLASMFFTLDEINTALAQKNGSQPHISSRQRCFNRKITNNKFNMLVFLVNTTNDLV